jgi:hypothetical protein
MHALPMDFQSTSTVTLSCQVDLTARLREILINYPEGTSILKEIVQVHTHQLFLHFVHTQRVQLVRQAGSACRKLATALVNLQELAAGCQQQQQQHHRSAAAG